MARILVASADESTTGLVEGWLKQAGHQVVCAPDGAAAIVALDQAPIQLLVTDVEVPYLDGVRLARLAHDMPNPLRVLLLVPDRWSLAEEMRAHEAGVDRAVQKTALRAEAFAREVESLLHSSGHQGQA